MVHPQHKKSDQQLLNRLKLFRKVNVSAYPNINNKKNWIGLINSLSSANLNVLEVNITMGSMHLLGQNPANMHTSNVYDLIMELEGDLRSSFSDFLMSQNSVLELRVCSDDTDFRNVYLQLTSTNSFEIKGFQKNLLIIEDVTEKKEAELDALQMACC